MGNKTSKSNPENVRREVTANDMRLFLDELLTVLHRSSGSSFYEVTQTKPPQKRFVILLRTSSMCLQSAGVELTFCQDIPFTKRKKKVVPKETETAPELDSRCKKKCKKLYACLCMFCMQTPNTDERKWGAKYNNKRLSG